MADAKLTGRTRLKDYWGMLFLQVEEAVLVDEGDGNMPDHQWRARWRNARVEDLLTYDDTPKGIEIARAG